MKEARRLGAWSVLAVCVMLTGCLPILPTQTNYNAIVWISINDGDVWARADTCRQQQLITSFTLGPDGGTPVLTVAITPDNEARIRLGAVEEIRERVVAGAEILAVTGVADPIIPLHLTAERLDALVDNHEALLSRGETEEEYLVGWPGKPYVTDRPFEPAQALARRCPPEPERAYESD